MKLVSFGLGIAASPFVVAGGLICAREMIVGDQPAYGSRAGDGESQRKKIVVLGTGWASMAFLGSLFDGLRGSGKLPQVTVVSKNGHFLFTPLLPGVISGTIEAGSLLASVRTAPFSPFLTFHAAEALSVDPKAQTVEVGDPKNGGASFVLPYDTLVIGVGATNNTFNTPGVAEHAHFLKEEGDALAIKKRLFENFELASLPTTSPEERARLLTTVLCGGGPSCVEAAGVIADLIREDIPRLFGQEVAKQAKVVLINSGDHILSAFDAQVSGFAEERFKEDPCVTILSNSRVKEVSGTHVAYAIKGHAEQQSIGAGLVIWSTGLSMRPIVKSVAEAVGGEHQKSRVGLVVGPDLAVMGAPAGTMYALGDCATMTQANIVSRIEEHFRAADTDHDGTLSMAELEKFLSAESSDPALSFFASRAAHLFTKFDTDHSGSLSKSEFHQLLLEVENRLRPFPATAQVANQQGLYLGSVMSSLLLNPALRVHPFEYVHKGSSAYVGGSKAVLDLATPFGNVVVGGKLALALYRAVYISKLSDLRTRTLVSFDWAKVFLFGRDVNAAAPKK
jgi:NADH dehydrogenase